jgi:hypothetical protein
VLQGRELVQAPERVQGLSAVRVPVLAAVQQVRVRVRVPALVRPEQVPERVPAEPLWAADRRRNRQWR